MKATPVLYILARSYASDLPSCNAGKMAAQCAHASNAFEKNVKKFKNWKSLASKWRNETKQGFGTVLTLSATLPQMKAAVKSAQKLGYVAELVMDPEYPYHVDFELAKLIPTKFDTAPRIVSGDKMVLFREEFATAYVFGDRTDDVLKVLVGKFSLHP